MRVRTPRVVQTHAILCLCVDAFVCGVLARQEEGVLLYVWLNEALTRRLTSLRLHVILSAPLLAATHWCFFVRVSSSSASIHPSSYSSSPLSPLHRLPWRHTVVFACCQGSSLCERGEVMKCVFLRGVELLWSQQVGLQLWCFC